MRRLATLLLLATLLNFFANCNESPKKQKDNTETISARFKPGQVWKYNNRTGEDSSTITILKVENYPQGDTIIHIRVDGINMYNPKAANGYSTFLGHLPFSEKAVTKSVTNLIRQDNNLPDFYEGYNEWKKAWDDGKAGYFTIDLKEVVNGMDSTMRSANK